MKFNKEFISHLDNKFNINLKFYFFLKHLVKTKLTERQVLELLKMLLQYRANYELTLVELNKFLSSLKGASKSETFEVLIQTINSEIDLNVFIFSVRLYSIKDLLLAEAKLKQIINIEKLNELDPLSLAYDEISIYSPYSTRVNGALLSLLFFDNLKDKNLNFISEDASNILEALSQETILLKKEELEPNQIFMLMFSESINQSIISDSGSNYEDRILTVLKKIGIKESEIEKTHDKDDKSTEFDFFFELKNKTYGIGAKRTLRERYKQFIKTSMTSQIDVMIEITLGLDLNESKARTIVGHGTKIFVSNEVYESRDFLREIKGVFSVRDLTLQTLESFVCDEK